MAYTRTKTFLPGETLDAEDYEGNWDGWRNYCNRGIIPADLIVTDYTGTNYAKGFSVDSFQKPDVELFGRTGTSVRMPSTTTVWSTQDVIEYVPANPSATIDTTPPFFLGTDNSGAKNLTGVNGILTEVYHKPDQTSTDANVYKNLPKSGLTFYLQEDCHVFVKCHLDVMFFKTARADGLAVASRRNKFKIMFDQARNPTLNQGGLFSGAEQVETYQTWQRRHIVLQADQVLAKGWHDVGIVVNCISRFGVVGGSGIFLETFQKRLAG